VHLCTSLRSLLAVSLERTIKPADGTKFNRIAERTNGMHGVAPLKKATRSDSLSETCRTRVRFARSSIVSQVNRASRPEKEASDRVISQACNNAAQPAYVSADRCIRDFI